MCGLIWPAHAVRSNSWNSEENINEKIPNDVFDASLVKYCTLLRASARVSCTHHSLLLYLIVNLSAAIKRKQTGSASIRLAFYYSSHFDLPRYKSFTFPCYRNIIWYPFTFLLSCFQILTIMSLLRLDIHYIGSCCSKRPCERPANKLVIGSGFAPNAVIV